MRSESLRTAVSTQAIDAGLREPTLASAWQAVAGSPISDQLIEWPPDVFALTDVILDRAEAFSGSSPPDGAPALGGYATEPRGRAQRDGGVWGRGPKVSYPNLWRRRAVLRERVEIQPKSFRAGTGWSAKRS
jgi:hypothetical protein